MSAMKEAFMKAGRDERMTGEIRLGKGTIQMMRDGIAVSPKYPVKSLTVNMAPTCPYCNSAAKLVGGDVIYPHRRDLYGKFFYQCAPCGAYVGCHPGTKNPLGRLANAELRTAKSRAHSAFDPIWKSGSMKRGQAYEWLSTQLAIPKADCHIGMFDVDMCRRVVEVCESVPV